MNVSKSSIPSLLGLDMYVSKALNIKCTISGGAVSEYDEHWPICWCVSAEIALILKLV
jgi:hypothetical protein